MVVPGFVAEVERAQARGRIRDAVHEFLCAMHSPGTIISHVVIDSAFRTSNSAF